VLIFFASYCGPCHKEMPEVATFIRTHDEQPIVVMGIDAVDVRASGRAFVKKSKVTFPIAFDPNGVVTTNLFKFETVPETVLRVEEGRSRTGVLRRDTRRAAQERARRAAQGLVRSGRFAPPAVAPAPTHAQ
jgi:thiol-disulfide isomerase/thioredoxin